jgi:hypothetical protein
MDGGVGVASSFYLSDEMVELRNLIGIGWLWVVQVGMCFVVGEQVYLREKLIFARKKS